MSRRLLAPGNTFVRKADPLPPIFEEPNDGDLYFNRTTGRLRIALDKQWFDVTSGGASTGGQLRFVNALGDTMKGNLDIAAEGQSGVYLSDAAGRKWALLRDTDGSLVLGCYDDAGVWLGAALVGDRMTRLLEVIAPPVDPMGIANKQFVEDTIATTTHNSLLGTSASDAHPQSSITGLSSRLNGIDSAVASKASVTISPAAPANPKIGDIWVNTA